MEVFQEVLVLTLENQNALTVTMVMRIV